MKWMMPFPLLLAAACQQPLTQDQATAQQQTVQAQAQSSTSSSRQEETPTVMKVIALKHASARDVKAMLEQLLPNRRGVTLRIAADLRLNSVLLSGAEDQVEQALVLIQQVDLPDKP